MVTRYEGEKVPPLSGDVFLRLLEHNLGGQLHFAILPHVQEKLSNIRPGVLHGLKAVSETFSPTIRVQVFPTTDPAGYFLRQLTTMMYSGDDNYKLTYMEYIADPISRRTMQRELETFFRGVLQEEIEGPIIEDELPYDFLFTVFGKHNLTMDSIDDYLTTAKFEADGLARALGREDTKNAAHILSEFPDVYKHALQSISWIVKLVQTGKTGRISHDAIDIAHQVIAEFDTRHTLQE